MKYEYDFSFAIKNPCIAKIGVQLTLSLDLDTVEFFEEHAASNKISCEEAISQYLTDCAAKKRQLSWT